MEFWQRRSSVVVVVLLVAAATQLGAADWPGYRYGPGNPGANPSETTIGVADVGGLRSRWTAWIGGPSPAGSPLNQSAIAVSGRILYVASGNGLLYAFSAAGASSCSGRPRTCAPLWRARVGPRSYAGIPISAPVVSGGLVYVGSLDGRVYAFDAAGSRGCGGTPKACRPRWVGTLGGEIMAAPTVADGKVFVTSFGGRLGAFDATGTKGCAGTPTTCAPLWTADAGVGVRWGQAVAGGVVYSSSELRLSAFDADGATGCSGTPTVCSPLWVSRSDGWSNSGSPAIVGGIAYQPSVKVPLSSARLSAFDAGGRRGCSGSPKTCAPMWTARVGHYAVGSPAVSRGVVYAGSWDHRLYAFDAAGSRGCSGAPKACAPLWTAEMGWLVEASPIVANGVVYTAAGDKRIYAFDASGSRRCTGRARRCTALWSATVGSPADSLTVANGLLYIATTDGRLHAFGR